MSTKAAMSTAASSVDLTVWPFSAWLNPTPTGWSRKKYLPASSQSDQQTSKVHLTLTCSFQAYGFAYVSFKPLGSSLILHGP